MFLHNSYEKILHPGSLTVFVLARRTDCILRGCG